MTDIKLKKENEIFTKSFFKRSLFSLRGGLERFGRTMLIPVSVLPILALIGSIGYLMISLGSHTYTIDQVVKGKHLLVLKNNGVYGTSVAYKTIADAIKYTGMLAVYNLDIIFAIGLAAGLAKREKASAALAGLMAIIGIYVGGAVILQVQHTGAEIKVLQGLTDRFAHHTKSYDFGALGGILAGSLGYFIHKYTYTIRFPKIISYFGGTKFPPVLAAICGSIVGMGLAAIWHPLYIGLKQMGEGFRNLKWGGSFLYGFTNRLLAPFGLHHAVNAVIRYTPAGGVWYTQDGAQIEGMFNIMLAKVANQKMIYPQDSMISTGTYVNNIFSMSGAAIAMFFAVQKSKRKQFAPIIFGATAASIAAGVTEPIEFSFIFVSPVLWLMHTVLTGLAYMSMYLAGGAQLAFTGEGIVTFIAYNVLNFRYVHYFWMLFIIGPGFTIIYFLVFYFYIKWRNIETPGRTSRMKLFSKAEFKIKTGQESILTTKQTPDSTPRIEMPKKIPGGKKIFWTKSFAIIKAYGGQENITEIANCISRLRISLKDPEIVDQAQLKALGALGIIVVGNQVQAVFGTDAQYYASCMKIITDMDD